MAEPTPAPAPVALHPRALPVYRLRILTGRARGIAFPIDGTRVIVGRGPGADLMLPEPALQRAHLIVEPLADRVHVRTVWPGDTFLWRGRAVSQAPTEPGDVVCLGSSRIQIERRDVPGAAEPAPDLLCDPSVP